VTKHKVQRSSKLPCLAAIAARERALAEFERFEYDCTDVCRFYVLAANPEGARAEDEGGVHTVRYYRAIRCDLERIQRLRRRFSRHLKRQGARVERIARKLRNEFNDALLYQGRPYVEKVRACARKRRTAWPVPHRL